MASFKINGGKKLHGEITPQGAKNEALQILSAVLLTPEKVIINNIPNIVDVNKLIDMGAQIILCDPHRATVIGLDRKSMLKPTVMTSPDIRAGVSLLIAALSADGESTIHNIEQIDRGYEDIENRLKAIGADITRLN